MLNMHFLLWHKEISILHNSGVLLIDNGFPWGSIFHPHRNLMRLVCKSISFIFEGDMEEPRACKWYANILIINIKDKKEACFEPPFDIAFFLSYIDYYILMCYNLTTKNYLITTMQAAKRSRLY
jgi:hypothetical protein